jgi:hypothetical protein
MGCHRVPDRLRTDTGTAPARSKNANRVANELPCVRPGEPNGRSKSCRTPRGVRTRERAGDHFTTDLSGVGNPVEPGHRQRPGTKRDWNFLRAGCIKKAVDSD